MEYRFVGHERQTRIAEIEKVYGNKRDWKKAKKLAWEYVQKGLIRNEDYEDLGSRSILGQKVYDDLQTIKKLKEQDICNKLKEVGLL